MRRSPKSLWLVPALLLGACGPSDLEAGEAPAPGTLTQGVLYAPPTSASGNILDSTTFMGNVAIPGSVQTYFTTNPQYFSFRINVGAGAQAKLEVTHLGSSMYLDTGLFVYGPKSASGSYGTTVLAQDDDSGYGQLSKLPSVTFAQAGEYLVVVSTGTGAGKQFRLQLDCLGGNCNPVPPPENYSLTLSPYPVSTQLQAELDAANTACGSSYECYGELRAYSFPWSYSTPPALDKAVEAVAAIEQSYALMYGARTADMSYAEFVQSHLLPGLASLHPDLVDEFGNGTEDVQVARYVYSREMWPDACQIWNLYILFFPESHRVLAFEQDHGQDC